MMSSSRRNSTIKKSDFNIDDYYSKKLTDLNEILYDTNQDLRKINREIDVNNNDSAKVAYKRKENRLNRNVRLDADEFYSSEYNDAEEFDNYYSESEEPKQKQRLNEKRMHRKSRSNQSLKHSTQTLNDSIHELHKKVRDISFEQEKLADHVYASDHSDCPTYNHHHRGRQRHHQHQHPQRHCLSGSTNCHDCHYHHQVPSVCASSHQVNFHNARKKCDTFAKTKKKSSSTDLDSSVEERLENRLKNVYNRIKKKYDSSPENTNKQAAPSDKKSLGDELKQVLEEFRNSTRMNEEHMKLVESEISKQKTQNELVLTKKRLVDLEESKSNLATQVQHLKEQLEKFESQTSQNNKQNDLLKEIEQLKSQLRNRSVCSDENNYNGGAANRYSNEIVLTIERYKKEIDHLNDNNQTLKLALKDKEQKEYENRNELNRLQERLIGLERDNNKLKLDLETNVSKHAQVNLEYSMNNSRLKSLEEQLAASELKREELKSDAQETIKLWKTKVKRLEKQIDNNKLDLSNLLEQVELLKVTNNDLLNKFETLNAQNSELKEENQNMEDKMNKHDNEMRAIRKKCEELMSENNELNSLINENKISVRGFESRSMDLQTEKINLEKKIESEETKNRELTDRIIKLQNELDNMKSEKTDYVTYISKLEADCMKLRNTLNMAERSEEEMKTDLTNISKQALQTSNLITEKQSTNVASSSDKTPVVKEKKIEKWLNDFFKENIQSHKENFEDTVTKLNHQLQQAHFQIQKQKLETEDKIRTLQMQLVEERSNIDIFKKREADYLNDLDDIKIEKQKIEDELNIVQSKLDKSIRNECEKDRLMNEYEEKYNSMRDELAHQKNSYFNKETDFIKILNLIDVDIDLLISTISTNLDKCYQPLLDNQDADKQNIIYLLIKHKIHWICKNLEELLQKRFKFQQEIAFLEHELDTVKKNSAHNLKAQSVFLKSLETQNNELLADREIALKNLELLEKYLIDLTDTVKGHSIKELERTHHLIAIDNYANIKNSKNLSETEKRGIHERFKLYKNTIDDIKMQLDSSAMNRKISRETKCSSSCSTTVSITSAKKPTSNNCKKQQTTKPKPFK